MAEAYAGPANPSEIVLTPGSPDAVDVIRCDEFEEAVDVYSLVNSTLLLASFALCLLIICGGPRVRVNRQSARVLVTWGASLLFGGLFLAATWPRAPDVEGCDGAASEKALAYVYVTIFSGLIWFIRGRRLAAALDAERSFGALDDDIAIAEERAYFESLPRVDLEEALLDGDDDEDEDAPYDDDDNGAVCELASVCVVAEEDCRPGSKASD